METEAQKASYQDNDIELYGIQPETGVCPICQAVIDECEREGGFLVSGLTPGVNAPLFHPWCRCGTYPIVPREVLDGILSGMDNDDIITLGDGSDYHISVHAYEQALDRDVSLFDIKDAIEKPLHVTDVKIDKYGRKSHSFIGPKATASVNPDTHNIATVHKTSRQRRKKYENKRLH